MPNAADEMRPLILTLQLDEASQTFFENLRREHFPPQRNSIPAHVSLFNRLPGEWEEKVRSDLAEVAARHKPFAVRVERLRSLGHGVAYALSSSELEKLREDLARRWRPFLGAQDRQGFGPHVTVQNKVSPQKAKSLLQDLERTFRTFEATGEGLLLWRYLGGPWESAGEFPFGRQASSRVRRCVRSQKGI